jgi:hypothetical protein
MLLEILPFALYTSPVSPGFAKQIMPVLCTLELSCLQHLCTDRVENTAPYFCSSTVAVAMLVCEIITQ